MLYIDTDHPKESFPVAIFMLIAGLLLGTVFTIGMQHWQGDVNRSDCITVKTQFSSYKVVYSNRSDNIKYIIVNCENGKKYDIDSSCASTAIKDELDELHPHQEIILLIHPNSDTILDFQSSSGHILRFENTIKNLVGEATGFLFLGIFMYICGLVGLYYVILHINQKLKQKRL